MFKLVFWTHMVVAGLVTVIMSLGYAAFGSLTQDLILFNLPSTAGATVIQILYMTNIIGSFIIVSH